MNESEDINVYPVLRPGDKGPNDTRSCSPVPSPALGSEDVNRMSRGTAEQELNEDAGPGHYLNPHAPLGSLRAQSTRIVRVPRDYLLYGDLAPAFSVAYPSLLHPYLPCASFHALVEEINRLLWEAYNPRNAWNLFDTVLALLTFWLSEHLYVPHHTKVSPSRVTACLISQTLYSIEQLLERKNEEWKVAGNPLQVVSLRRTAFLNVSICSLELC